jgi:hypothetical protein
MNDQETTRNPLAAAALITASCALLSQPVLGSLLVVLLTGAKRYQAIGPALLHVAFVVPPLLAIVSIILGHTARRRIRGTPGMPGAGQTLAALIVGYATLVYAATALVVPRMLSRMIGDF